jgi:hypothetical protein
VVNTKKVHWLGDVGEYDDFGNAIADTFYDGKTIVGRWAMMSPVSWSFYGYGQLGTGYGQKYKKQTDGSWLKVEG